MPQIEIDLFCGQYDLVKQIMCDGALSCPHTTTCNRKNCRLESNGHLTQREDAAQMAKINAWPESQELPPLDQTL